MTITNQRKLFGYKLSTNNNNKSNNNSNRTATQSQKPKKFFSATPNSQLAYEQQQQQQQQKQPPSSSSCISFPPRNPAPTMNSASNHGGSSSVFLNYFSSLSRKKPVQTSEATTIPVKEAHIRAAPDLKNNTSNTSEAGVYFSSHSTNKVSTCNNNNSSSGHEIATAMPKQRFNLVKSLVRKHELEMNCKSNNNKGADLASLNSSRLQQTDGRIESGQQRFFVSSKSCKLAGKLEMFDTESIEKSELFDNSESSRDR